jgi:hypothetical protein
MTYTCGRSDNRGDPFSCVGHENKYPLANTTTCAGPCTAVQVMTSSPHRVSSRIMPSPHRLIAPRLTSPHLVSSHLTASCSAAQCCSASVDKNVQAEEGKQNVTAASALDTLYIATALFATSMLAFIFMKDWPSTADLLNLRLNGERMQTNVCALPPALPFGKLAWLPFMYYLTDDDVRKVPPPPPPLSPSSEDGTNAARRRPRGLTGPRGMGGGGARG